MFILKIWRSALCVDNFILRCISKNHSCTPKNSSENIFAIFNLNLLNYRLTEEKYSQALHEQQHVFSENCKNFGRRPAEATFHWRATMEKNCIEFGWNLEPNQEILHNKVRQFFRSIFIMIFFITWLVMHWNWIFLFIFLYSFSFMLEANFIQFTLPVQFFTLFCQCRLTDTAHSFYRPSSSSFALIFILWPLTKYRLTILLSVVNLLICYFSCKCIDWHKGATITLHHNLVPCKIH